MLIKKDIRGKAYIDLMNYAFENCDAVFVEKLHDQHPEDYKKTVNIILSECNCSVKDIVERYSDRYLFEMCNRFKENEDIFDIDYRNNYEQNFSNLNAKEFEKGNEDNRKRIILGTLSRIVYNELTDDWLNKFKEDIILQEEHTYYNELQKKNIHISTFYYLKLTKKVKDEILKKQSLYSWVFPNSIENLCFFKNGYCWLDSVAHEKFCEIYCKNEEEYEYLKSIGIQFIEKKFIPVDPQKTWNKKVEY